MKVRNVFRMNDWGFSEFLVAIFAVQFGLLGLQLLGALGCEIPLIRPIVGFLYLTFVPGLLLLRVLRIHGTSGVETVLYAAGLSLAFGMLAGFLVSLAGPWAGIDHPITEYYVVLALFLGVVILAALAWHRDRDYRDAPAALELDAETMAPALFLLLAPMVAVLGAYLVNASGNSALIYVAILAVALITVLCGFGRFIPERLYPLAIVSVAASLLFHNALVTGYLWSWDVHHEYNIANQVIAGGFWDTSITSYLNSMLSIVFLAPFYHYVCHLDLTWVFKIVYQLLFCLVPLGMYAAFRRQAGDRIACLACLFFASFIIFYTEMQGLARQEVAELFLVLIVLLMTDSRLERPVKSAMMAVFGIGLVVSHYGLAYIYLMIFPLALALLVLIGLGRKLSGRLRTARDPAGRALPADGSLTLPFIGLFACFLLFWYTYTSDSSALKSVTYIGYRIGTGIFSEFLDPDKVQGLGLLMQGASSPLYDVKKYLHLAFQGFIAVGFVAVVAPGIVAFLRKKAAPENGFRFSVEYVVFAFVNLLICIGGVAVPYFASSLNTSRLYQITLVILAPLAIIGALALGKAALFPLRALKADISGYATKAVTLLVVVYLLFNVGLVFDVLGDHPMSVSLSKGQINSYSLNDRAGLYDSLNTFEEDYYAATWLADRRMPGRPVYSDYIAHYPVSSYGNTSIAFERYLTDDTAGIKGNSYVYLGYVNLKGGVVKKESGSKAIAGTEEILPGLERLNKVYSSDGSSIYYSS